MLRLILLQQCHKSQRKEPRDLETRGEDSVNLFFVSGTRRYPRGRDKRRILFMKHEPIPATLLNSGMSVRRPISHQRRQSFAAHCRISYDEAADDQSFHPVSSVAAKNDFRGDIFFHAESTRKRL